MTAAQAYRERVEGFFAQGARLALPADVAFWDSLATQFRMDARRELDGNLQGIAALLEPGDVVVDAGGGAGRVGLPLALRCRELVNVEPSPGMQEQFAASAAEAGIENARGVQAEWTAPHGVEGDVTLVFNVTYFVADIVPFVEKLVAASRRRVIIGVWSVPPPAQNAGLFRVLFEEEQVLTPGHRELLPVLWEMGVLPDVRVLPERFARRVPTPPTREEAVKAWLDNQSPRDRATAERRLEARFDELFTKAEDGYHPTWRPDPREVLITWETR